MRRDRHLAAGNGTVSVDVEPIGHINLRGNVVIASVACSCHLAAGNGQVALVGGYSARPTFGHDITAENGQVAILGGDAIIATRGLQAAAAGNREIALGRDAVVKLTVGGKTGDSVLPHK